MTINVTPAKRPSLNMPLESPIWAKIRPTSHRGIIATPTRVLSPLNQMGGMTSKEHANHADLHQGQADKEPPPLLRVDGN